MIKRLPHQQALRVIRLLSTLLACGVGSLYAQESGPKEVIITYRCQAADRPAFRSYLETEQMRMLSRLKVEGTLKRFQVLFNPVVTETFDAMVIMDFSSYGAESKWEEVERRLPGGLSPAGLKLAKPLMTYFADLQWEGRSEMPAGEHPIFYVIPYSYNKLDQYKSYIDAYVVPQVTGWMKEGVLASYAIYLDRYPVGDPWDCLFIYEYRDRDSFGKRETTIAKVRSGLKSDPTWKHWSDIKATIRSESENTIMEELTPKPEVRANKK
jgi:hypothetical protein